MADAELDERATAMARRLTATGRRAGLDAPAAGGLADRFLDVLRARGVADAQDPAYLHPARNALILMEDLGVADVAEVSAAIGCDGVRRWTDGASPEAAALLAAIPFPGDALLEQLVSAAEGVRRIALADRLDHARHLHLGPAETWTAFHAETRDVWLPVAERTHAVLARRLRWWTGMFERRWLARLRP